MALRRPIASLLASLVLLGSGAHLIAQYSPGDLIVASGAWQNGGTCLIGVRPGGSVYSIQTPFIVVHGLMPSPDNRTIWIAGEGPQQVFTLGEIAPDGSLSTILRRYIRMIGPDGEGGMVCFDLGGTVKVQRGPSVTTVHGPAATISPSGYGMDLASGDLITSQFYHIHRLTLTGRPSWTTLGVLPPGSSPFVGRLRYDPATNLLAGPDKYRLMALRWQGGVALATAAISSSPTATPGEIDIDPGSRLALFPYSEPWNPGSLRFSHIDLVDLSTLTTVGRVLSGSPNLQFGPSFVMRAHSRHLCGISPALRGGVYSALVSYPAEPGAAYVVGFSFGLRPGIWLPDGRVVCLRPDPLLALSLTNSGIFSGCRGTLDQTGEAVAHMAVPRINSLQGLRIFAAAITIANGQIGTISAPIGVTIQ